MDQRSFSLLIKDAKDNTREAPRILRWYYAGSCKPRMPTLYNQLTTLKKSHSECITDYSIKVENAATALNATNEMVKDSVLVRMVLKQLPDAYTPFTTVISHQERFQNFEKFKQALRNLEENKKTKINKYDYEN